MELQQTLQDLAEAMAEHRRAVAGEIPALRSDPAVLPVAPKVAAIRRLMDDVQRVSGIRVSDSVETKLVRIFASVGPAELEAWARQLHFLDGSHPEWLSLIESLTVHETYFYRDPAQLDFLAETMLPDLVAERRAAGRRRLRIWSAGCATGEEAFTLAILALEALVRAGEIADPALGIPDRKNWQVEVLGTDISRAVLRQAEAGHFQTGSLSAFREMPPRLQRYFIPGGEGQRRIHPAIVALVSFQPFNLLSAVPPGSSFDLVSCRNVMIYMAPDARRQVQEVLDAGVRPGGLLMLGPTDAPLQTGRYDACWGSSTVIYRKRGEHAG